MEVETQEQVEQDFFEDTPEAESLDDVTDVVDEPTEPAPEPQPDPAVNDLVRQNQELQRRMIEAMEAQRPKPAAPAGPDLREILGKRFDDKTATNLAEALEEYKLLLRAEFAGKDDLNRMSGTLAHYARNADEARVFEEFRHQGVPDSDIKESRKLIDHLVENEGAYFPNAQIAMDAAYGRLKRQRARETAGKTTAARAQKTAQRQTADMGASRGGVGVPILSKDEKEAAYSMDTADFLDWFDKKTGK